MMIDVANLEQRLAVLEKAVAEVNHHLGIGGPPAGWWEQVSQISDPEAFRQAMEYLRTWWQNGGPPDKTHEQTKYRQLQDGGNPNMIDEANLERRLAGLEQAVAEIQRHLKMLPQDGNWVEQVFPPVRDEEALQEAMEHARALRGADYPVEEPTDQP
jgi:hypothetical protein